MPSKCYSTEEIITKIREAEVHLFKNSPYSSEDRIPITGKT